MIPNRTPWTRPKPCNRKWNGKQQALSQFAVQWLDKVYFLKKSKESTENLSNCCQDFYLQPLPQGYPKISHAETRHAGGHAFRTPRSSDGLDCECGRKRLDSDRTLVNGIAETQGILAFPLKSALVCLFSSLAKL